MDQVKFTGQLFLPVGEALLYKKFYYYIDFKKGKFSTFFGSEGIRHESFENLKDYVRKYLIDYIDYRLAYCLFDYEYDLLAQSKKEIEEVLLTLDKIKIESR